MTDKSKPSIGGRVIAFFHTLAIYLWVIIATLIVGLTVILVSFIPNSENFIHKLARAWGRSIVWVSRIKVQVFGSAHLPSSGAVIYMSNHQSNFDIPVFYSALPVQFRWLAKAELFKIPIFGRAMSGAGYISIDRSDPRSALRSLKNAAAKIRNGTSVLIFPEGTRSREGNLLPFKTGGFTLAIDAGVPIIPLAIQGTRQVMAKGDKLIHFGKVRIRLMPPVETAGHTRKNKKALMDQVYASITAAMDADHGERVHD